MLIQMGEQKHNRERNGVLDLRLLNKERVALQVRVKDWKEAVRVSGQLLVDVGSIESCYIDAIIENMREYGPNYVLAPGVAMPHASCSSGVHQVDISVVTLANEVAFMDSLNNPVKLVICLAATDNNSHIELLKKVSQILSDETCVQRVKHAKTVEEVLTIFNS